MRTMVEMPEERPVDNYLMSFEQLVEQRNERDRMDFMNPDQEALVMIGMDRAEMFG